MHFQRPILFVARSLESLHEGSYVRISEDGHDYLVAVTYTLGDSQSVIRYHVSQFAFARIVTGWESWVVLSPAQAKIRLPLFLR